MTAAYVAALILCVLLLLIGRAVLHSRARKDAESLRRHLIERRHV